MKPVLKNKTPKAPAGFADHASPAGAGHCGADREGSGETELVSVFCTRSGSASAAPVRQPQFLRMVRPGSSKTPRPQAGGEGFGCPARMSRGILPAPPRRHTSTCASEGGILAVRPRGRIPSDFGIRHAGAGARTPSRLWTSRPCGTCPQHRTSKAGSQSALRWPLTFVSALAVLS
jgi:hypothetical protein